MEPEPPQGQSSSAEGLCALLKNAGVLKTSVIRLVGRGGLPALLWLCRHGYEQVAFTRAGPGPSEPADVVLAPNTCEPGALEAMLVQLPHVTPGAIVILRTRRPSCGERETAPELLRRGGFHVEQRLRGRRRDVYVARRCGRPTSLAEGVSRAAGAR